MSDMVREPGESTFEEALGELDRIVEELEGGQLELEQSIERYQRGVELLKALQSKLAGAQQKVTMLIGELEEEAAASEASSAVTSAEEQGGEEVPF
jgi:exodeoxyribonuclease VII small subunit